MQAQTQIPAPAPTPTAGQVSASVSQIGAHNAGVPIAGYAGQRRSSGGSYTSMLVAGALNRAATSTGGNSTPMSSRTVGFGGSKPASAVGTEDVAVSVGNTSVPKTSVSASQQLNVPKVGPRLRAEGVMAPPASDAATLRRQVAALQLDLEGHVESEKRLQGVNQQLRERLELYMQQNHENVERAESELNTLHEDMEQTLDLQRRLAQRATSLEKEKKELEQALQKCLQEFEAERSSLQSRITRLNEELREKSQSQARARAIQAELELALVAKKQLEDELNGSCIETDYLKHKAEEYATELERLMSKKQRDTTVERISRRNILRRTLQNFKEAIEEQRLLYAYDHAATDFARTKSCKRGLQSLQLATKRAAKIRQAQERQAKTGLEECWRGWRLTTVAQKKYETAVQRRKQAFLFQTVNNWRSVLEMGKLSKEEEYKFTNAATKHWRRFTSKQYLKRWQWWMRTSARPKKIRMQEIQVHLDRLICRQAFFAWKSLVRIRQVRMLKKERACNQGALGCKRRALSRWLQFLGSKKNQRRLVQKAFYFYSSHQRKFVVACWLHFLEIQRQKRISSAFAFRRYLHALVSKGFNAWKQNVMVQQAEQRAVQEINQAVKRASMLFWRDYLLVHAVKKKKEMKALVNRKRREKKAARALLIFWWEEMAWRRRAGQLTRLLASRRQRTLVVNSLYGWIHATFDNLLVANAKFQNELLEAKAQCDEQKQQTTAVDVENLQLIDRLHAMSSEIALLKITIAEKEKQEDDLRRALEDGAVIEGSLQGDLEQQSMRIQELELDVLNLQKKLQMKNLEDTAGEVHHTMEIQNLERTLKDFQTQLAEKTAQLDSYEKALKETAEKLEGASDESQEKLTSAFEIAASLRRLLEDRESQYATLEGNCRRKELELNEVQRKLSAANTGFSEAIDARDTRIHELENILMQKQAEMQEAQLEFQEMQRVLDIKEASVRRLEYEMKLKSDRESQRAKAFVSSLTSWTDTGSPKRSSPHLAQINESIRSVYNQARAALQEADQNQQQPFVMWARQDAAKHSHDVLDMGANQSDGRDQRWLVNEQQQLVGNHEEETERASSEEEDEVDEKTGVSHAPYVTEAGSLSVHTAFGASHPNPGHDSGSVRPSTGEHKKNSGKAESLHEEIQQLQARIMSRLRDPSHIEERSTTPHCGKEQ